MCGIAGQVGVGVEKAAVERMLTCIVHRGPDDQGVFADEGIAFGIRRLSIIDIEGGKQPVSNEDGSIHVVLNGEIYNYVELRQELLRRGHQFRSQGDTEVIAHLYEEYGDRFVDHLNGMFAIALWDSRNRRLLLVRDRLGKKPVYWCYQDGRLWFGSELKCLRAVDAPVGQTDLTSVYHYLVLGYMPHPHTVYTNVRQLPPGGMLEYRDGHVRVDRYWEFRASVRQWDEREAAEHLRDLLTDAVRIRLRSDVPLGAFLSGGLDSSIVVALMAQLSPAPVKTFHIRFSDDPAPEHEYAQAVADQYGTEHHVLTVTPEKMDVLDRILDMYDEPFGDSSAVPTWYVSGLTKQYVTVALAGDGGDESFAGYNRYRVALQRRRLRRWIGPACRLLGPAVWHLTPHSFPGRRMIRALGMDGYREFASGMPELETRWLLGPALRPAVNGTTTWEVVRRDIEAGDPTDPLSPFTAFDTRRYLPDDILVKVDRASMSHALEVRAPLLDYRVVEFAATLPAELKLDNRGGKRLLKIAFGDMLPEKVLEPRKRGFSAPLREWLAGELAPMIESDVLNGILVRERLIDRDAVQVLVDEHRRGRRDHRRMLWRLLVLARWLRRFG